MEKLVRFGVRAKADLHIRHTEMRRPGQSIVHEPANYRVFRSKGELLRAPGFLTDMAIPQTVTSKIASYLPHAIVCAIVQGVVTIMKHDAMRV
jgi:hypothetical protein